MKMNNTVRHRVAYAAQVTQKSSKSETAIQH
jgi:hypothetical protein